MHHWYYTSHKLGPDGVGLNHLGIARTPSFWAAWESICDWVCSKVFRDRWCHLIAGPAMDAAEKRTVRFEETIPVSAEWVEHYHAWRGWERPWWLDEDEDSDE